MSLTVYYLNHSGFVVETDTKILVFDYYKDPSGIVDKAAKTDKPFWFFVSHNHSDHFNPHIGDFACHTAYYIYNEIWQVVKTQVLYFQEDSAYQWPFTLLSA